VFAFDSYARFAAMQSRVHESWARMLSSSMRNDLRYSPSDCFENFPFPAPEKTIQVEAIGEKLYTARAQYMSDTQQGLTLTYNQLKDPRCQEPQIFVLRQLHEEMERAVLDAYEITGIVVPPYCPQTPAEEKAVDIFSNEVIDRLFDLNAARAKQELLLGTASRSTQKNAGQILSQNPPQKTQEMLSLTIPKATKQRTKKS
jgi:hypothetical protein